MCFCAIRLPTPREPECRNSHTPPVSSAVTSMKWLPDPRVPSCRSHRLAYDAGSKPASAASAAQLLEPLLGVLAADRAVRGTGVERDGPLDRLAHRLAVAGQVAGGVLGAHGDHAAADVHADGGRDDRTEGRDDRPDGGTQAEVCVGHQRDVRVDERHRGRLLRLRARVVLEDRRPADERRGQVLHRPSFSGRVPHGCGPTQDRTHPETACTAHFRCRRGDGGEERQLSAEPCFQAAGARFQSP